MIGLLKIVSWTAPGSILEAPGLDFRGFWDVQIATGWPQGLQIPCNMVSKTTVFGRSNLNAKNFDFGMRACAFPQKAWPRLGGGGVPPWGPSMELELSWPSWSPRTFPKASKIQSFAQGASQEAPKSLPKEFWSSWSLILEPAREDMISESLSDLHGDWNLLEGKF